MGYGLFGLKRHVHNFFVGSYGSEIDRGVYVFQLDEDNGEILKKKFYKTTGGPSFLAREDRWVYTCYKNNTGRATDGGIWQYAAMDVQFGLTARISKDGKSFEHCYPSKEHNAVYAVDYYNGEVAVIPFNNLHKVVSVVQIIKHTGSGPDQRRQMEAHPTFVCLSFDNEKIIVCDLGTDEIVFYNVIEKGRLERNDELSFSVKAGNGPKKLLYSKDGQFAYLLNELANTIEVYKNDHNYMTLIQTVDTFPKEEFGKTSYAGDMTMMEDAPFLFASNRGHDSVGVFEINEETGLLTYIEYVDTDANPKALQVFKGSFSDGEYKILKDRWLVVASQKGGSLESWEIKTNDRHGVLFETNYSYSVSEPVTIALGNQNYIPANNKK